MLAGTILWRMWAVGGLTDRMQGTWAEDWTHEELRGSKAVLEVIPSLKFDRIEDADAALRDFVREPLPYEAGFLAGKAFVAYKKRGGAKRSPIPDFYVGAHAVVGRMELLTRDATRYRTYFPKLKIVSP